MKKNIQEDINRNLEIMGVSLIKEQEQEEDLVTLLGDTTITRDGDYFQVTYDPPGSGNRVDQCFQLWLVKVGNMDSSYAKIHKNGKWYLDFCIPTGKGTMVKAYLDGDLQWLENLGIDIQPFVEPKGVDVEHDSGGCSWKNDELEIIIDPLEMNWVASEFKEFLNGERDLDFGNDDIKLKSYKC